MQELGFDPTIDSATQVALMRNDIAHQSVQALIDDLEHVTTNMAADERADAARAVLAHHEPPVADALLSEAGRRLQRAARTALTEMADGLVVFDPPDGPATTPVAREPETEGQASEMPAHQSNRWRSMVMAAAFTGGIATGGFTVGALLQRFF